MVECSFSYLLKVMVMVFVICIQIFFIERVWLCAVIFNVSVSRSTSEPFGIVFDCAEGRAVAKASIDHRVDGEEVSHGAGKETSI